MNYRPFGLLAGTLLALLLFGLTGCTPVDVPPKPPIETPMLPPDERGLVVPGLPGLYLAWGSPSLAIPPTRAPDDPTGPGNQVLGLDCLSYLGSGGDVGASGVWERRSSFDWRPYDTCLTQAAQRTVKLPDGRTVPQPVILTLPAGFMDTGSRWYRTGGHGEPGTVDNPFIRLHLPPWMQNDTYRFTFQAPSGVYYQSVRYGGEFKQRMIEFLQAAGERYNSNPQVAGVRVYVGQQGESQPVTECQSYWDTTAPAGGDNPPCGRDTLTALLASHEQTVSCSQYTTFVRDLSEAALRAFPDKPVMSIADAGPCSNMNGKRLRRWLFEDQWTGKPIGLSMNNLNMDRPDADERPENRLAPWNKYTSGRTLRALNYPMLYEFDAHSPTVEGMYWTILSGAGNGGSFILYHSPWNKSFSSYMWEVIDYWLGSERRAWLVFRDREYPTYDSSPGFGASGSIGDFSKYLELLNPEDAPQACSSALSKSAASANATVTASSAISVTPACPGPTLPPPAITRAPTPQPGPDLTNRLFNRQARLVPAGVTLRIRVSGDWSAYGNRVPAQITVSYLDTGRDAFTVIVPGPDGKPVRKAVQKTGTGLWQRTAWDQEIYVGNLLEGDVFLRMENDTSGAEYLHEVFVTVPDEESFMPRATSSPTPAPPTSTPSSTAPPTRTPTLPPSGTPAPTSTPTAAPPSATPTAPPTVPPTVPPVDTVVPPTVTPTEVACLPRLAGSLPLASPRGLAVSDRGFYVGLFEPSEVALVDPAGRSITWDESGGVGRVNGLAVWRDTVITTNRDAGAATLLNAATGEEFATVAVGSLPWGVAAGDGRAYVASFGDNTLAVIDLAGSRVLRTVSVSAMPVTAVIAEDTVYLLHLNGVITRLDRDGNVLGQSSAGVADTRGIAYDPLRKRLYVGSESGQIVALRIPDLATDRRYPLPGPAYAVAVNEGTGRIFAVDAQNDLLYVLEPGGGDPMRLPLPDQGDSQGGQGLAALGNRVGVTDFGANSVTFFDDGVCPDRITPVALSGTSTPTPAAPTFTPTRSVTFTFTPSPRATTSTPMPTRSATATATPVQTPQTVRAKVEIVWPHGNAGVEEAELANVTVYLLAGDGTAGARSLLDSVPCDWNPVVRLWAAEDNQPARQVGIGQKRLFTEGGRTFPVWDFNDIDVSHAQDPANKISFSATVDGVRTLPNIWTHAADARTLFPRQDTPASVTRQRQPAVDARIQIVWPHDDLPPEEAQLANVTAVLFNAGTLQAIAPDTAWSPVVRLHSSLNNESELAPGEGVLGVPRVAQAANGIRFLAWDFNDIDVTPVNDSLNRMTFWVTVDGTPTYSNYWAHAVDARTLFPQADVLNSCK